MICSVSLPCNNFPDRLITCHLFFLRSPVSIPFLLYPFGSAILCALFIISIRRSRLILTSFLCCPVSFLFLLCAFLEFLLILPDLILRCIEVLFITCIQHCLKFLQILDRHRIVRRIKLLSIHPREG